MMAWAWARAWPKGFSSLPRRHLTRRVRGIALRNVAERIEKFYGVGSGVEIVSKLNEGTCVTLRLADAVSMLGATVRQGKV